MANSTSTPLPNHAYRDAQGQTVSVTAVAHNRVTFYREVYQFPCLQPIERLMKEYTEVKQ